MPIERFPGYPGPSRTLGQGVTDLNNYLQRTHEEDKYSFVVSYEGTYWFGSHVVTCKFYGESLGVGRSRKKMKAKSDAATQALAEIQRRRGHI